MIDDGNILIPHHIQAKRQKEQLKIIKSSEIQGWR